MNPLSADQFQSDPRIKQAKQMLLATLQEHQQFLTGVKAADPSRQQGYQELLETFTQYRGAKLWYPYLGSGIGRGALVELLDGSVKYDFITGIGVHCLGHSHPEIVEACIDAALSDLVHQGNLQQNADSVDLAKILTESSGMDHCFFSTSGVMANENALKIAFQARFPAQRILTFSHCFAGRTVTFSQVTDKPAYRKGLPPTTLVDYIPFFDAENPEESTKQSVAMLVEHLERHPGEYAAFFFEPVQGEGGFYPGSEAFFKATIAQLKKHNVIVIADEVQTFGRTHSLFAYHHFELEKLVDIVTIGKLSHVCATLFNKELAPEPGLLAQTFTSTTAAFRVSRVIIEELLQGGYFGDYGKIAKIHTHFEEGLTALSNKYPEQLQGPFGMGSMVGFTPFGGDREKVLHFLQVLFTNGVIAFIAGTTPARVRLLVPIGAVVEEDVDQVLAIIEETIKQCL